MRTKGILSGWGVNDSSEPVKILGENGKYTECHHYTRWSTMIRRCLVEDSGKLNSKYYWGTCEVSKDFKYFSVYKEWEISQGVTKDNYRLLSLDKDIIKSGNNIYSKETCCIVPKYVNTCVLLSERSRTLLPVGVVKQKGNRYTAKISVGGVVRYLGSGNSTEIGELHSRWQLAKVMGIRETIRKYKQDSEEHGFLFREDVERALLRKADGILLDIENNRITTKL